MKKAATKRFREYQLDDFVAAFESLAQTGRFLLSYCVSAGKTYMALALASLLVRRKFVTHVVILCPTRNICQQFCKEEGVVLEGFSEPIPFLPFDRRSGSRYRKMDDHLLDYLKTSGGTTFVCTYNTFRGKKRDQIIAAVDALGDRILIVIDEVHHVHTELPDDRGNWISRTINRCKFMRRLGLSGTPYRTSDEPVKIEDEPERKRVLSEHMIEGFTPRFLAFEILTVPGGSEKSDLGNAGVPLCKQEAIDLILNHMKNDGWPKSILRCKTYAKRYDHEKLVEMVQQKIEEAGRTAITLYSDDADANMKECIEAEKARLPYSDLKDVIVTLRRGEEGGDFPSRSHLYLFGCPRSPRLLEQLFGRILRLRVDEEEKRHPLFPGYSDRWLHESKVVFVVAESAEIEDRVSETLFRATMFISTLETSLALRDLLLLNDGFQRASYSNQRAIIRELAPSQSVIAAVQFCIRHVLALFRKTEVAYRKPNRPLQVKEMFDIISQRNAEIIEFGVVNGHLQESVCLTANDVFKVLNIERLRDPKLDPEARRLFKERVEQAPFLVESILQGFEDAYEAFKNKAFNGDYYRVDGEIAEEIATLVRSSKAGVPPNEAEILVRVNSFRTANEGRYPLLEDSDPVNGLRFQDYDSAFKQGRNPLECRSGGLPSLILKHSGGDWFENLRAVAVDVELRERLSRHDPEKVLVNKSDRGIQRAYQHIPEMAYYLGAYRIVQKHGSTARNITLEEAERLGRLHLPFDKVEALLASGTDAVRQYLETL